MAKDTLCAYSGQSKINIDISPVGTVSLAVKLALVGLLHQQETTRIPNVI